MPLDFFGHVLETGLPIWVTDNWWFITKAIITVALLVAIKLWSAGSSNPAERDMHGRVVMITGGTSGIGAATVLELARRGAQIVLLTSTPVSDPFLVEYISDVRARTNNQLIYAEQVDLASLHSIRKFATKWIDNAPPRRLDMIVLCAATITPAAGKRMQTKEGIEEMWMVNYLSNFHLLSILSPAIKAQPFDRDVRIIFATCSSYIGAGSLKEPLSKETWSPSKAYKRSKLALMVFGQAFQKHLNAYKRPDELPMNSRVYFVDPGFVRTPGMRRWLSRGTLWGLFTYLVAYPVPWLLLKSPEQGAQSILYAAMESSLVRIGGGKLIKECQVVDFARKDVEDKEVAKKLWEESDKLIETTEKEQAAVRALQKKAEEEKAKQEKEAEKIKEVEALVEAIKKGKESQKPKGKKKAKKDT
ncbi:short chain dehydrogenase/reductase family Oxidoreductase [Colletotrichum graminicola]|uniref:Short chain dehydrogenase/reductase family Oxidoreductase n=1 Tax=Colletotrichum graminicola (strain M1.001 / M2 / FGSC 10212) TaxID=645133 RepID=E3QII7_COLGM|nr:short chain dehydrogenase/reductase family Oxidoreductase [Colletotrichum graminicola M1.001]EFQ30597.1 short chain dehydrogenase/reductase family Oxidoreductase [Colletotrichum graminicola M1.001]WDK21322.1 short chain dehydrogenase/reductase family Oxidoreductase [Colletotrichum graminicola]